MTNRWDEVELSDGGCIQPPEDDNGTIRRKDKDGNTEEIRCIGEDNWHEWAELWELTESDFYEYVTGRSLLEALKEIDETSPERLEEPLFATYDNDDQDVIIIKALLTRKDTIDVSTKDSPIVLLEDDSQGSIDLLALLDETLNIIEQTCALTMLHEDYTRCKEIKQIVADVRKLHE